MRTIFFGTPEIAVPALKAVARATELTAVVCQPDSPAGRGMKLRAPAVKRAAEELGLPVHQPKKMRTGLDTWLSEQSPDIVVVMAYGRILPESVLSVPKHGFVNLHTSLLPHYRGAAPIQWAVINGEKETGVALMQIDAGMDTGAVYTSASVSIHSEETSGELSEKLAAVAATLVEKNLENIVSGALKPIPQDHKRASHARKIEKLDARLDFRLPAKEVAGWINGLSPQPAARARFRGKDLVLLRAKTADAPDASPALEPGVLRKSGGQLLVRAGDGYVEILQGKSQSGKVVDAQALMNGLRLQPGDRLEPFSEEQPA